MTNPRLIWKKVERDQALNMGELAHASGYDRGALRAMNLPWQHGKLSLYRHLTPPVASASANGHQRQAIADKFDQ
jgi:hypothetical protein